MNILRTPIYQDVPQAFIVDKWKLKGAYGQTLKHFAEHYNYSLKLKPVKYYKMSRVQKDIEKEVYNLSIHGAIYQNLFANISFSYPVEWSKTCVIVTAEEELPRYWYLVWPFGRYIWIFLVISVIYVAILMQLLKHPSRKFSGNLLKSMAVIIYSSNMNLKVLNVPLRLQLFYCILLIMGFIINSYYINYLTAYNMRPIFQPSPRDVSDVLKENIKIWVPSQILEELHNSPYTNLTYLEPMLVEKTIQEVSNKIVNFSRSLAYVVTQNDWMLLKNLQRYLIQPLYRATELCFGDMLKAFPLQSQSKFSDQLNQFILIVHQSGLWAYWQEEAFLNAMKEKYFEFWYDSYPVDRLNLYYYRLAWIVFGGGVSLSCICIVMEIVFYKRFRIKLR